MTGRLARLLLVVLAWPAAALAGDAAGRFDFYLLSLTWSPSYCEAEGGARGDAQCRTGRRYGFLVHGLWPQYERGFPEDCPTRLTPSETDVRALADLMPARGLVRHEWRRHGACSGLAPADYLRTIRAAREAVRIPTAFQRLDKYVMVSPAEVEAAFVAANPGLRPGGVAVTCDGRRLREVRICLTRGLGFRACEEVDRRGCRADRVVLPPVR
ncbi:Ribonuclease T2 [uncultured Pleomorphomonas sp.]|uniref:Ribonuclease T2 n=1 Tax=uncultured Pleomorphomonas sp. TaxID=442121 RepID=A0A212LNR3_9HYPH|nr:ribonuclease T2 [uncultured Pleomorphomonas sp.]SCM79182.1 Ribonuclease T2 [uncultured Pleomorphomonas sp.]